MKKWITRFLLFVFTIGPVYVRCRMKKLIIILIILLAVGCQTQSKSLCASLDKAIPKSYHIDQHVSEVDINTNTCAIETKVWINYNIRCAEMTVKKYYQFELFDCDFSDEYVNNIKDHEKKEAEDFIEMYKDR